MEFITCSICKLKVEKRTKNQITCGDPVCKVRQHTITSRNSYTERSIENKCKRYEKFLMREGYLVIPPTKHYKIIMEPI